MIIHTVCEGESVLSISKKYRVNPELVSAVAEIGIKDKLLVGEELLIPIPTRSYTVRQRDTLEEIAGRFGIRREALLSANPQLMGDDSLYAGQVLAIKYENMGLGMAAACGYLSPSCKKEKLVRALPYLTYVALCHGSYNGRGVNLHGGIDTIVKCVRGGGKIPLLRIFDTTGGEFLNDNSAALALESELIEISKRHALSGIIFASYGGARCMSNKYAEFIMRVRRSMIGHELIFITECDEWANNICCELSDGGILVLGGESGFQDANAESKALKAFAEGGESSKIFVDIPAYALYANELIPERDARRLLIKASSVLKKDKDTGLSVGSIKNTPVAFEGVERLKAKLTEIGELGYMGVNFDIENAPIWQIMLFYTMFTPVGFSMLCPCV